MASRIDSTIVPTATIALFFSQSSTPVLAKVSA